MREIKAILRPDRLNDVLGALHAIPSLPGVTVSHVEGVGRLRSTDEAPSAFGRVDMTKLEIVVPDEQADAVVVALQRAARTGNPGDGKIFVVNVADAVGIRSGEHGNDAL